MKKMKQVVVSVLAFLVMGLSCINAQAASEVKAIVEASAAEVKGGEEVTVTLKFDSYGEIAKGINAYKATLDYDKNVFEEVLQSDFTTQNDWEELKFNKDTGEFVAIKKSGSKSPEAVVKIKLKVRANEEAQESDIRIKDVVTSEGKKDITIEEKKVTIAVVQEQGEESHGSGNQDGAATDTAGGVVDKIPSKTGDYTNWVIWFAFIVVDAVIIVAYINKGRWKKVSSKHRKILMFLAIGFISMQTIGTITAVASGFLSKGELNDDGQIDYKDLHLMELHLIHQKELPQGAMENADMNNDGSITVTDLSLLVQKLEKSLDYEVTLSDAGQNNYYPQKNEEVKLVFFGDVSYDALIEKVTVNNQEYPVGKTEDGNAYTVNVGANDKSGVREYRFTEVLLNNDKKVPVDYAVKVDVLKTIPSIENYTVNENINESKAEISFDLKDDDNSVESARLEVVDENEGIVQKTDILPGENRVEASLEDGKKYRVNFFVNYDLDTNELTEHEEDHTGTFQDTKELEFIVDYQWKISDIHTYKDGAQTTVFEKNEPIQIMFSSSNASRFEPTLIKVNGKEYSVTKENQQYMATVDGISEVGSGEIKVEEVVLANGKRFPVTEGNVISVTVLKQKPVVRDFNVREDTEKNTVTANFSLHDEDNTMTSAKIVLLDADNKEIGQKVVKAGENEVVFDAAVTSRYTVKILATYRLSEQQEVKDGVLLEKMIEALPRAEIQNVTSNKVYAEKSESITLQFKIATNKVEDIQTIRVNNLDCTAKKLGDGTYEVVYGLGEESGIQELHTTKLTYTDGKTVDVESITKVEVLKDKPSVQGFLQQDNMDESSVTLAFDLVDKDQSFVNGKAVLKHQKDGTTQEKPIVSGENSILFPVKVGEFYTLEIVADYDRDSNTLEGHDPEENKVTNEILDTRIIGLVSDYQLQVGNVKSYKAGNESKYFDKNEEIVLRFESSNATIFKPQKAVINGKEYGLSEKEGIYEATLPGIADAGKHAIKIEKIILDNTKEVPVTENNQTEVEVLKDRPKAEGFKYTETEGNQITATFHIVDGEKTIQSGNVIVYNENKQEVKRQEIVSDANTVTWNKTSSETYDVEVQVSYDLDSNAFGAGENEYQNQSILKETITISDRMLEMKDINGVSLYRQGDGKVEEITNIHVEELKQPEQFLVKVEMKDLPAFYSEIRGYKVENETLKLVLDFENAVQYIDGQKQNFIEVEFGKVKDGTALQNNFKKLLEQIKENPSGSYELTTDVDAGSYMSGEAVITEEFSGTIDFNGHTITNLSRPLFKSLKNATIQNLVIADSKMTASGVLANTVNGSTIKNVHVTDSEITAPNGSGTGALAGYVESSSTIEECSVTDVKIGSGKGIGGLVGKVYNSTVKNSYVADTEIVGSDCVGGLAGETPTNAVVENCYAKVDTNFTSPLKLVAGLLGNSSNVKMKNSLSLARSVSGDNNGNRVIGGEVSKGNYTNNYELETSNLATNASSGKIDVVKEGQLKTKEFYTQKLGWDESVWDLDGVEKGERPTLKNADPSNRPVEEKPGNDKLYIPGYARLKDLPDYDASREVAYYNMYRFMPYYDAKYYVADGNQIDKSHILNTKMIKEVLPYDENGKLIVGLPKGKKDSIKTIKVVFEDDTTQSYSLNYKNSFASVTNYKIEGLGVGYNYDKYLIDTDSQTYQSLIAQVKSFDYEKDIASLTEETEVRNYTEHYPKVKEKAEEFVLKFLANNEEYTIAFSNPVLDGKVKEGLESDNTFKKVLYAYNYFDRFYNFEIGGINITDIVFFDGSLFASQLNSVNMTNTLLSVSSDLRRTEKLPDFYNNKMKPYTNQTLGLFVEYFIKNLTEEKYRQNPASWLPDHYWGTIYEYPAKGHEDRIEYRAWEHMKNRELLILPILSYKGNDFYVVGTPTTVLVGSMRLYFPDNFESVSKEEKLAKVKSFCDKVGLMYGTIASIVKDEVVEVANQKSHISYDTTGGNQSNNPNCPEVYKGFNEVIGKWPQSAAAAAYADGRDIYWIYDAFSFFNIFSHESLHNQDAYLYLEGTGRRRGASGEMFTDGFLTQGFGEFGVLPNYSIEYKLTDNISVNASPERINSREKINDYYSKMFEVFTTLEYLEGQAFLQLTPEEQSKIAFTLKEEVIFPNQPSRFLRLEFVSKTAEEFKQMNLKDMEDLWDNKLVTARDPGRRDMGSSTFTGSSMWYIGNYDDGLTEETFKTVAYQMLGEFGYDGYVKYAGATYDNDLAALRGITGDPDITWKQYQMDRYERVESKLKDIKYFDPQEVIDQMVQAMRSDIANEMPTSAKNSQVTLRKVLYGYVKRATNDFRTGGIYDDIQDYIHVSTAEELMNALSGKINGNVILDADIDFSSVGAQSDTYLETFTGTINGNGHKITGLQKPLFDTLTYSKVENLTIENATLNDSAQSQVGALAKTADKSILENIQLKNVSVSAKTIGGGLVGLATQSTVVKVMADHVTITGGDFQFGSVFGKAEYTTIEDTHVTNSTLNANRTVGGIVGLGMYLPYVTESTANTTITAASKDGGGLIGEIHDSVINNCYSLGSVNGGNSIGGIVGWAAASKISNCFSDADVNGRNPGGFIGSLNAKNKAPASAVEGNVSFGNAQSGYKFDGSSSKEMIESSFKNNYEYSGSTGNSTLTRTDIDFTGKISTAENAKVSQQNFYTNDLKWDASIWDFSNVATGGLPKLKNSDPNNVTTIAEEVISDVTPTE